MTGTTDSFEALVGAARSATRADRIEYRDRIAAFGPRAIAEMQRWIPDREVGAFAVRVIESAAALGWPDIARVALRDARPSAGSAAIAGDIDRVLARLGPASGGGRRGGEFDVVEDGLLQDGRRYITYRIRAHAQGGHFNVPRAVMDDLGIPTDGDVDLHVVASDVDFRGVVAIASGTDVYYRAGDDATHGLLNVRPGETITVTASRTGSSPSTPPATPEPWRRNLSIVHDGIEVWAYPRPGPRTWAFRWLGESEERHWTRQHGATDAIDMLRHGRDPGPGIDPYHHLVRVPAPAGVGGSTPAAAGPRVRAARPRARGAGSESPQTGPAPVAGDPPAWVFDLDPVGLPRLTLLPGTSLRIWVVRLDFAEHVHPDLVGLARKDRWPVDYGKPLVEPLEADDPVGGSCAEIEVARRLRRSGWDAWWSDGYRQAPDRWKPWIRRAQHWSGPVAATLAAIAQERGTRRSGGLPDVIAHRDGRTIFVECKGPDDKPAGLVNANQRSWLEAAAAGPISLDTFVLAEYGVRTHR